MVSFSLQRFQNRTDRAHRGACSRSSSVETIYTGNGEVEVLLQPPQHCQPLISGRQISSVTGRLDIPLASDSGRATRSRNSFHARFARRFQ